MPDLRPLRQAEQKIISIEEYGIEQARDVYTALRYRLLDLQPGGRLTPLQIQTAFRFAAAQLREIATSTAKSVERQAASFAGDELQRLASLMGTAGAVVTTNTEAQHSLTTALVDEALVWLSGVEGQLIAEAVQLQLTNAGPQYIQQRLFADDIAAGERASVWRSGLTPLETAIASLVWGEWNGGRQLVYQAAEAQSEIIYRRQAIAAIDKRTTQCCLNVHGQIVDMDKPFKLTGTPRYGSELMWAPFHWRCRTSIVLYHEAMEAVGITTSAMRTLARLEEAARSRGGN